MDGRDKVKEASVIRLAALAGIVLISLAAAGCDKCGNRVNINRPAIQQSCEDNTQAR